MGHLPAEGGGVGLCEWGYRRMHDRDWFRNEDWNPQIEKVFCERQRRARDKAQYLKLQAFHLVHRHPEAALSLLDKFFELKQDAFLADALVIASRAYLALNDLDRAVKFLKAAIERERAFPNHRTTAWHDFAVLVVVRKIESEYDEVLRVLGENRKGLIFPVLVLIWHGAYAVIMASRGEKSTASAHARQALGAASLEHSGLRYHPGIGLAGAEYGELKEKLRALVNLS